MSSGPAVPHGGGAGFSLLGLLAEKTQQSLCRMLAAHLHLFVV